jgi:hypothetical protein
VLGEIDVAWIAWVILVGLLAIAAAFVVTFVLMFAVFVGIAWLVRGRRSSG